MPQMTTGQARVVDVPLTTIAQGYKNAEMVGNLLFPYVPVSQRGGKIIAFGREDFALYATGRAPGAATKRVQFGYASGSYALESHSLEGLLPVENMQEASAGPGVDLGSLTVAKTQAIIALRLEKAQADLATNAANYAASNKTTSLAATWTACMSRAPWVASSSAPSTAVNMASAPPASSPMARSCGQEKVGYSSTLSSTPRRPDVPAPA